MLKDGATESQIIANLRDEFLDDAGRRLEMMVETRMAASRADGPEAEFKSFKAELHTMKGMGQSFGFASITMISRRLEEFLKSMSADAFADNDDVQPYLDAIHRIIDARIELDDNELDNVLNGLAAPPLA